MIEFFNERDERNLQQINHQLVDFGKQINEIRNSNPPPSVYMRMKFKELMVEAENNRE